MNVPTFTKNAGVVGVSSLTPINGDREQTTAFTDPASGALTSGDLSPTDVGDLSGTGDPVVRLGVSMEFWFTFNSDATPASTQFLCDGPEVSAGVRQWAFSVTTTGAISLTVRHTSSGAITATSAAGLASLQPAWTHVVGVLLSSSNLVLYVNGAVAATTAWPAGVVATASYAAGVSDMRIGKSSNVEGWLIANLAIYSYDLSAGRVAAHYSAGTARGFPAQATGIRIGAVLDAAGSTASRSLGAGARSVTATYMRGQTPKDAAVEALSAEAVDAGFFASASGTLTFLDAAHRSSAPYNTVQATFDDDGTDLPYIGWDSEYSDANIVNIWNVTREGSTAVPGVTQTVSDSASISAYDDLSQSLTSLPVVADSDALAVATGMLAKYKDALWRVTMIAPKMVTAAVAEAVYRLDLMARVRIFKTPPGGGARFDQTLFVQSIHHSGKPGEPPQCELGVSPL